MPINFVKLVLALKLLGVIHLSSNKIKTTHLSHRICNAIVYVATRKSHILPVRFPYQHSVSTSHRCYACYITRTNAVLSILDCISTNHDAKVPSSLKVTQGTLELSQGSTVHGLWHIRLSNHTLHQPRKNKCQYSENVGHEFTRLRKTFSLYSFFMSKITIHDSTVTNTPICNSKLFYNDVIFLWYHNKIFSAIQ